MKLSARILGCTLMLGLIFCASPAGWAEPPLPAAGTAADFADPFADDISGFSVPPVSSTIPDVHRIQEDANLARDLENYEIGESSGS